MSLRVFVARDASALSVGADATAAAIAAEAEKRGEPVTIVRTGTRGMLGLEPLVEVETPKGRMAYGPVTPADVASLCDAGLLRGDAGAHALSLGPTEQLPWMARQQRVSFARVGVIDPLSLSDYRAHGGMVGLERARGMSSEAIVQEVITSGLAPGYSVTTWIVG